MIKQSQVCPKIISSCLLITLLIIPQSLQAKETKSVYLEIEKILQKKLDTLNSELEELKGQNRQLTGQLIKDLNTNRELSIQTKDLTKRITDLKKQLSKQQSDIEKQFLKEKDKYEDMLKEQKELYSAPNTVLKNKIKELSIAKNNLAANYKEANQRINVLTAKLDDLKTENRRLIKARAKLEDQLKNPDNKILKDLKNRIARLKKELSREKETCIKIMNDSEDKIHTLNAKHKTARRDLLQDIEKEKGKNKQLSKKTNQLKEENSKLEKDVKTKDFKTLKEKLNKVNKGISGLREELLAEKKKIKTLVQDKIKAEKDFAEFKQEAQYFEDEMLRLKTKNDEEKKISEFYQQRLDEEKQERAKIEREIKTLKFESKPAEKTTD
ncbi:MAG: hypothetical protein KAX15_03600 [Candidatus Omnitrophica bacterium]|nr:hypothetical protein [Candidatus Omnitrophota bacterium]